MGCDNQFDVSLNEVIASEEKDSRFDKKTNPLTLDRSLGETEKKYIDDEWRRPLNFVTTTPVPNQTGALQGQYSKALGSNPKDLYGAKKVSITKLPAVAIAHAAHAMMDGAKKYGPYNWRANAVIASIYIDAAIRHLLSWFDQREETAPDSGVHHLGHAIACAAILLDAQATGNLIDDRPNDGKLVDILNALAEKIQQKAQELQNAQAKSTQGDNTSSPFNSGCVK